MLKDVSRINNREQQESWSNKKKRRRKKDKDNSKTLTTRGGDTLDLSSAARYLSLFKQVDFKHREEDKFILFELTTSNENYTVTLSGNINTQSYRWELLWLIESEQNSSKDNVLPDILFNIVSDYSKKPGKQNTEIALTAEESKKILYDDSGEAAMILKDFLTLIQNLLPLSPPTPKTNIYTSIEHFDNTGNNTAQTWPSCFNRHKVTGIRFRYITRAP